MILQKSQLDINVDKKENLVNSILRKKREYIQNTLVRPVYQEALKSLFLVGILLIDTLIPLELYRILTYPLHIVISLIILGIFLYIEIRLYDSIWGKKGRWSIEKYKKPKENTIDEKKP